MRTDVDTIEYRLIWPADVLKSLGHDIVILPPTKDSGFLAKFQENPGGEKVLTALQVPNDADVIVIQRPAHEFQPQMVDMLRSYGIAVVIDMDDDLSSIHRDNVGYMMYHPRSSSAYSWKNAAESCKRATFVTTSTKLLQKVYAPHGRGVVIDNYVPEKCLHWEKIPTGTFGWAGTTQSHPNDLQVTGKAVQQLIDSGLEFRVVGTRSRVKQVLKLRDEPPTTGTVDLIDWVKTIAETYDVGLVPLAPGPFNSAKSRLKGIEHMAAGVPWVASPREEYRRLHRESGCGLLAETPKDWFNQVQRLMGDEVLRKEQTEMGKEFMKDQTYQAQAWRWAEAWETALKIQRG